MYCMSDPKCCRSHPSRVRGLKPVYKLTADCYAGVAPITGAWIETVAMQYEYSPMTVAPITGAWIETLKPLTM